MFKNKSPKDNLLIFNPDAEPRAITKTNRIYSRIESLLDITSLLTLSIVVFGILILGVIVAPTVFSEISPRPVASELMTNIFGKYYKISFFLVVVTVISELLRLLLFKEKIIKLKTTIFRLIAISFVFLSTVYTSEFIYPSIDKMRIENKTPTLWNNNDFVYLHKLSEFLGKSTFTIGIFAIYIIFLTPKASFQKK